MRVRAWLCFAAVALAAAGCGIGPPRDANAPVTLRVTRDFGETAITSGTAAAPRGRETALDLLKSGARVDARRDGSIRAINEIRNAGAKRWLYWVDGTQPSAKPGSYDLAGGDVVQFDYGAAPSATAIVGAFPNPFVVGGGGKRLPVDVECESDASAACGIVRTRLSAAGVVPAAGELGTGGDAGTLRAIVARWPAVRALRTLPALSAAPATSGVYARFDASGARLALLDAAGHAVETAPPGTGLIAALAPKNYAIAWVITGLDQAAVDRAARAFDTRELSGAFAIAATPGGVVRLPLRR